MQKLRQSKTQRRPMKRKQTSTSAEVAELAVVKAPNLSFRFFSFSSSSIWKRNKNIYKKWCCRSLELIKAAITGYSCGCTFCETEETFTPKRCALFFSWSTSTCMQTRRHECSWFSLAGGDGNLTDSELFFQHLQMIYCLQLHLCGEKQRNRVRKDR